jgi:hypothetical protein
MWWIMNSSGCLRNQSWPKLRNDHDIWLTGLRKTAKNLSKYRWYPCQDWTGNLPNKRHKYYCLSQFAHWTAEYILSKMFVCSQASVLIRIVLTRKVSLVMSLKLRVQINLNVSIFIVIATYPIEMLRNNRISWLSSSQLLFIYMVT